MSAHWQALLLIVAGQTVVGYLLIKVRLTFLAWLNLLFWLVLVISLFFKATPVLKMIAIVIVTLNAMKTIVTVMGYKDVTFKLSFIQWVAFSTGWVGMRTQAFESLGGSALPGAMRLVLTGFSRVLLGGVFIAAAHMSVTLHVGASVKFMFAAGLILTGLSFILHFGLLVITAGLWRFFGAVTYPLFRQPGHSNSLAEFWGKRWNLAFIEMLSIAILRPLKNSIGTDKAILLSFFLSGLLHELAITLPVNAGFGGPTIYFIIQGLAVTAEKKMKKYNYRFLENKVLVKLWLLCWLVAPVCFLFPAPFIQQIVWPLAGLKLW